MISAQLPNNEKERLKSLLSYQIMDTLPEEDFDDLAQMASQICDTPISLIGLIDERRQWYKSKVGMASSETAREFTFCAHNLLVPDEVMIVPDSRLDERFFDNPLVLGYPHIVFYTGVPLITKDGFPLGSLCVIDNKPKKLSEQQLKALKALANQFMRLLELRKTKMVLESSEEMLIEQNIKLNRFASVAAHDLKSPLNGIAGISKLLADYYKPHMSDEVYEMVTMINDSSQKLSDLIAGILNYSTGTISAGSKDEIPLRSFFDNLVQLLDPATNYSIVYKGDDLTVSAYKTVLEQLFINLVSNSVKYNDSSKVEIEIGFDQVPGYYQFYVQDNGRGIKEESLGKIFDIFHVEDKQDRFGQKGNGIGLATVKKLVEDMGGAINVKSQLGVGTRFTFTLAS